MVFASQTNQSFSRMGMPSALPLRHWCLIRYSPDGFCCYPKSYSSTDSRSIETQARCQPQQLHCLENLGILLANSTGQNRCGKICLHRSANRDKNRALVLSVSTKIRSISRSFLLAVISPAVSLG